MHSWAYEDYASKLNSRLTFAYNAALKFEMFRRANREEEHELKIGSGIQHHSTSHKQCGREKDSKGLNKPWWNRKQNRTVVTMKLLHTKKEASKPRSFKLGGVSVAGQTGDKRKQSPSKPNRFSRLIGDSNETSVFL